VISQTDNADDQFKLLLLDQSALGVAGTWMLSWVRDATTNSMRLLPFRDCLLLEDDASDRVDVLTDGRAPVTIGRLNSRFIGVLFSAVCCTFCVRQVCFDLACCV